MYVLNKCKNVPEIGFGFTQNKFNLNCTCECMYICIDILCDFFWWFLKTGIKKNWFYWKVLDFYKFLHTVNWFLLVCCAKCLTFRKEI